MKIPHTSVIFINNYTNPKLGKIIKKINNIIIGQEQQSYPKKVDIFLSCTVNNGSKHLTIFYTELSDFIKGLLENNVEVNIIIRGVFLAAFNSLLDLPIDLHVSKHSFLELTGEPTPTLHPQIKLF